MEKFKTDENLLLHCWWGCHCWDHLVLHFPILLGLVKRWRPISMVVYYVEFGDLYITRISILRTGQAFIKQWEWFKQWHLLVDSAQCWHIALKSVAINIDQWSMSWWLEFHGRWGSASLLILQIWLDIGGQHWQYSLESPSHFHWYTFSPCQNHINSLLRKNAGLMRKNQWNGSRKTNQAVPKMKKSMKKWFKRLLMIIFWRNATKI